MSNLTHNEQDLAIERIGLLGRRFHATHGVFRGPLPTIPLLNVVLLLVLFVVMNSSFVLKPGIVVNLPTSSFAMGAQDSGMVVTISQEGMIFFNDERTTFDGLASSFSQMSFEHPEAVLIIEADGRVPQSSIVQVYNMAMSAGIRKVLLATRVSAAASGATP